MGRRLVGLWIGLVAVVLAAGCQSLAGPRIEPRVGDDSAITAFVKIRLVADRTANLTRLDIDTNRGTVFLSGAVDTAEQRERAEQFAWQARGVKDVVNALRVVDRR